MFSGEGWCWYCRCWWLVGGVWRLYFLVRGSAGGGFCWWEVVFSCERWCWCCWWFYDGGCVSTRGVVLVVRGQKVLKNRRPFSLSAPRPRLVSLYCLQCTGAVSQRVKPRSLTYHSSRIFKHRFMLTPESRRLFFPSRVEIASLVGVVVSLSSLLLRSVFHTPLCAVERDSGVWFHQKAHNVTPSACA